VYQLEQILTDIYGGLFNFACQFTCMHRIGLSLSKLPQYKKAKDVVNSIKVVNDIAERHVGLMSRFNESLTSSEEGKQQLLQVVEDNCKRIKSARKSELVSYKPRTISSINQL
jgi:hypothetical protein